MAVKKNPSKIKPGASSISIVNWKVFVLITALCFITYGNSIKNDYNIDDSYVVSLSDNSDQLKGIRAIPNLLFSRYNEGEGVTVGYRPMGKISLAIEYSLWGNNPHASHFVNVFLFSVCVFLLFLFASRMAVLLHFKEAAVIYIGTIFFIVHPIHTEVVCSIKNREEILAGLFMLSALLLYTKPGNMNWKRLLLMSVVLLLAFLSKETSFVVLAILPLISLILAVKNTDEKSNAWSHLARSKLPLTMMLVVVLLLLKNMVPNYILPPTDAGNYFEQIPLHFYSVNHLIPNGCRTLLFYIGKLIIPYPLGYYYGYNMLPDTGWNSWIPYAGLSLIGLAGFGFLRLLRSEKGLFPAFWLGFFSLSILPLLNFIPGMMVTGTVGERLTFIASMGFCLLLSTLLVFAVRSVRSLKPEFFSDSRLLYSAAGMITLVFLVLTLQRNTHWKDKWTLYHHDIEYLSESARANLMLAGVLMNKADKLNNGTRKQNLVAQGKKYNLNAVKIYPEYDHAWKNLGVIYLRYEKNIDSAAICFNKVSKVHHRYFAQAQGYLGDIDYINLKDIQGALEHYRSGLDVFPVDKTLYNKCISLYFSLDQDDEVEVLANRAIENGWPEAYVDLGDIKERAGQLEEAVLFYEQAIQKGFRGEAVMGILKEYYLENGDIEKLRKLELLLSN